MTSTKNTDSKKANSVAPWKSALKRLETMQGQMGARLFDRIRIAVQVFDDGEFRAGTGNVDDSRAARFLDGFFPELFFDHPFQDLRAVLEHFPKRADWAQGHIRKMWQTVLDHQSRRAPQEPKKTRRVISRAEHNEAVSKRDRTIQRLKQQAGEHESREQAWASERQDKDRLITALRGRVAELEAENADLKARLLEYQNHHAELVAVG